MWDIIVTGDLEDEATPSGEQSSTHVPKTIKQLAARRNQERIKSILLLAIPDEYLLKFHNVLDAKFLWATIKSRFGGNEESKKMQKNKLINQLEVHGAPISKEDINQKFLRSLPSSWNQIAFIMRNKPDIDEINIDDLYNNLRVYEDELKRSSGSNFASQNLAFLSSENTSSTNELIPSLHNQQPVLNLRMRIFSRWMKMTWRNWIFDSIQLNEFSSNHETDSENSFSVFDDRSSDEESTLANNRSSKVDGYKAVPPPITGNFLTPRADISFAGFDEYAIRNKIIESQTSKLNNKTSETTGQTNDANTVKPKSASESVVSNPKINRDRVIIEDWHSDDEEEVSEVQKVRPENQTVKTRDDKSGQTSKKQGIGFKKVKACFVCKSTDHLIKDYNFHDKKSQESKLKNVVNTGQREGKPVWDNTKGVSHQNFSKYPHLSISTARPVYASRPIYPRMDNVRPRGSCLPIKRSYYTKPAFRPKDLKQDVKTFGVKNMTTVGKRAVVNTGKGKLDTNLKRSRWVWRPKGNYLDHVSKDSESFMLKKVEAILRSCLTFLIRFSMLHSQKPFPESEPLNQHFQQSYYLFEQSVSYYGLLSELVSF
ncbi:hypothetical protein Tco_0155453 [Tanacetum coccineum]